MFRERRTTLRLSVLIGLATVLLLVAAAAPGDEPAPSDEPHAVAADEAATAGEREAGPGRWSYLRPRFDHGAVLDHGALRVHLDPQTRAPIEAPDKAVPEWQLPAAIGRSHEGLEAVELANGYTYVDTRGRLFTTVSATLGEDGTVEIGHGVTPAAEPEETDGEAAAVEERP